MMAAWICSAEKLRENNRKISQIARRWGLSRYHASFFMEFQDPEAKIREFLERAKRLGLSRHVASELFLKYHLTPGKIKTMSLELAVFFSKAERDFSSAAAFFLSSLKEIKSEIAMTDVLTAMKGEFKNLKRQWNFAL